MGLNRRADRDFAICCQGCCQTAFADRVEKENLRLSVGADGGTRTRTGFPPRDFKSLASTISPRPRQRTTTMSAEAGHYTVSAKADNYTALADAQNVREGELLYRTRESAQPQSG